MQIIIATLLIWLFPGFLACGALFPSEDELRPTERLSFSILLSLAIVALLGLLLAVLGIFTVIGVWVGVSASVFLFGSLAVIRRFEVIKILHVGAKALLSWNAILFTAAFMLTMGLFVFWASQTQYAIASSAWYYFKQAMDIIRAGMVPGTTIEYGWPMYFVTNKIGFNLITAAFTLMTGLADDPRAAMYVMWPLIGLTGVIGAWTFLRRQLRPFYAMIAFVGLGWTELVAGKMSSYRAEAFGIALLFITLHIIHRAFAEPESFRWAALAGIALGLLGTSHGVPALVCVFWYASLVVSALLYERAVFFQRVPHMAFTTMLTVLIVFGTFSLVGGGQVTNQEAVLGSESYDLSQADDPTQEWLLLVGGFGLQEATASRVQAVSGFWGHFYVSPANILSTAIKEITLPLGQNGVVQTFIIVVAWWVIFLGRRRTDFFSPALVFLTAILMLWALYFSYHYDTNLPAVHPLKREMPYLQLVGVLILGGAIDRLDQLIRGFVLPSKDDLPDRDLGGGTLGKVSSKLLSSGFFYRNVRWGILALAPLIGVIWIGFFGYNWLGSLHRTFTSEWTVSDISVEALAWLAENTLEGSVIATNVRTTGQFDLLAERASLAEGRAPYLQPENLARSFEMLVDLYKFFEDPENEVDTLERLDPDYVVFVRKNNVIGDRFAGWETRLPTLRERSVLEEQVRFGEEDEIVIYEVVPLPDE
jgi:hypothetical protein